MKKTAKVAIAILTVALAAWAAAGPAAKHVAARKAREAGYELRAEGAKVRLWTVYLEKVTVSGKGITARVEEVRVGYDWKGVVARVEAEGADIEVGEREEKDGKAGRGGRRPEVVLIRSTVHLKRGSMEATARVREARLKDGKVWATADVLASRGTTTAEVKGLRAEGVTPGGPMRLSAKSTDVRIGKEEERLPTEDGNKARRRLPTVQLATEKASFERGGIRAEAEGVEAEVSLDEVQAAGISAKKATLLGTRMENLELKVRKTIGEPGTDIRASAESVETEDSRLSSAEFAVKKIQVRATVDRDKDRILVSGARVRVGASTAVLEASLTPTEFKAKAEMPEVECGQLLESLPAEMVPRLRPGTEMSGTITWRAEVTVDLPGRKKPDVYIWMKNKCVVKHIPEELDVKRLRRPFWREVYSASGEKKRELAGPGTPAWTPIGEVSQFMPMAVMAMEDPSFMSHRGIVLQAIENSMEQNITAGRFVRGGSTISMQLAKNLWLAREKTISRKVQEAFLTTYLEQSLTKQQMIELYLNIVEFGPNLYGIGPAARKYFAKDPSTLTLSQSLFLASLLPSPKSAGYEEGKQVSSGRLGLLRKVMKMMLDRGTINGAQYEQGLRETPVFGEPSPIGGAEEVTSQEGIDPSEWR